MAKRRGKRRATARRGGVKGARKPASVTPAWGNLGRLSAHPFAGYVLGEPYSGFVSVWEYKPDAS